MIIRSSDILGIDLFTRWIRRESFMYGVSCQFLRLIRGFYLVYHLGTLNGGSWALSSDGFSESNKKADTPHRLLLPGPIRSVTTGRFHTVALTATLDIYTFLSWGRPYRMVTDLLSKDPHSPDAPVQIECGWAFSAVLTHGGRVLVWWPFNGALKQTYDEQTQAMEEQIRQGETRLRAPASNGEVHCHLWDVQTNPFLLPDIPGNLPTLNGTGEAEEVRKKDPETRLIKIAGADNMLIGLTNRGHVLKYGHLAGEHEYRQSSWQYVRVRDFYRICIC
jgi:SCF-associated factor 1